MSKSPLLDAVAEATAKFCEDARSPRRIEVEVASREGMPLLCAVEAALRAGVPGPAPKELVWLSGGAEAGAHRLTLRAYGEEGRLIAEAAHAFEG